jgi:hypothetical protein
MYKERKTEMKIVRNMAQLREQSWNHVLGHISTGPFANRATIPSIVSARREKRLVDPGELGD